MTFYRRESCATGKEASRAKNRRESPGRYSHPVGHFMELGTIRADSGSQERSKFLVTLWKRR